MKILAVNAGSSSLKFQLFEMPQSDVILTGAFERVGLENSFYTYKYNGEKTKKEIELKNHDDAVKELIKVLLENKIVNSLEEIKGVGHRVVHGGDKYFSSVVITDEVIDDILKFSSLAPLHNPANLEGINAFKAAIPEATAVAVFDTAFHQTMSEEEYLYAVPKEWYESYMVRKYGFHGTSHKYISSIAHEMLKKDDSKIITLHVGNGVSLSAVKNGKCVDTTMGFTPNSGVIMGTRCGDIDFNIVPYIAEKKNIEIDEVINSLNKDSGLKALSGVGSDCRDIEDAVLNGDRDAMLAFNKFVKAINAYIARYYFLLNGVDAIVFAGGIGEKSRMFRQKLISSLEFLNVKLDEEKNNKQENLTNILTEDSKFKAFIICTDEELMIAKDTTLLIERLSNE